MQANHEELKKASHELQDEAKNAIRMNKFQPEVIMAQITECHPNARMSFRLGLV